MASVEEKEVIDFIKSLEKSKLITPNAHKNSGVVDTVKAVVSMSEEEHDEYQKKNPNKSVLLFFSEYQDWKESYS
jgi:peptide methionine sulfoxide reductase MsrA